MNLLLLPDDKTEARKLAAQARKLAHGSIANQAALSLAALPFPAKPKPGFNCISAFHPYKSEIDTRQLLGKLAGEGWTTALPVVMGPTQPLIFRRWLPGEPTTKDDMGIEIPLPSSPHVEPDVLIVPMLAFDRKGFRLGYGGGYYDRTLATYRRSRKIIAIGAAYATQEAKSVPHQSHDQPLDFILTEREVIPCA